jgi:aryl-alcohol dehydrogenase-like predicted oxidoreductase
MLHRAEQMNSKETMDELVSLSGEGIVKNIGVSVQHPAELKNALSLECISIIQMPFNILDHRWDELLTMIKSAKKHRKLLIHARSALLQGLLCSENFDHWKRVGVQNGQEVVNWLDKKHKEYDTSSVAELCIRYVNSQAWIDSVVIGVDSIENLFANLSSVSKPLFHEKALSDIENSRPQVSEETLNPATWS